MLLPACTGTGLAVFAIDKSAEAATATLAEAMLLPELGSPVTELTESDCVIVLPEVALVFTITTKLKLGVVVLAARLEMVQVSVASVQVQPVGPVSDTAVVLAGSVSVNWTVLAATGPALVTLWV
jgi:hypothetical protein